MDTNEYKYAYDSIGNRQWAQMNAQSNSYVANDLNQYTNIIEGGTPETLFYDADGNLTNANGWTFSWNGENRLIRASDGTTTVSYVYDYMGRRIRKDVVSDTRNDSSIFIYDGWNLIAELGGMAFSPARADYYVWGLDLSGSLQGAGGIGGLLAHIPSGDTNTTASAHLAFCDANGNITDYIAIYPDGSGETNGTVVARYQYDPYGNLIEQNGPEADTLRFRFSSKYYESELETATSDGLYYYGYRFYSPTLGRWMSRDPIAEEGGINLYVIIGNDLLNGSDYLGLDDYGERLTKKQAEQLACAIKKWMKYATAYDFIFLHGESDLTLTRKFLKRYLSKEGGEVHVDYSKYLEKDAAIQIANARAVEKFASGEKGPIIEKVQTEGDLTTSINRVRIQYTQKASGIIQVSFPTESYTFSDTDTEVDVHLFFMEDVAGGCCWKGGDRISDEWLHDLEIHGYAKSFEVKSSWVLYSIPEK